MNTYKVVLIEKESEITEPAGEVIVEADAMGLGDDNTVVFSCLDKSNGTWYPVAAFNQWEYATKIAQPKRIKSKPEEVVNNSGGE